MMRRLEEGFVGENWREEGPWRDCGDAGVGGGGSSMERGRGC